MSNNTVPSAAEIGNHRPVRVVYRRRMSFHPQRCRVCSIFDHPLPHIVLQRGEPVFRHGMLEVVGPAAQNLVEPHDHVLQTQLRLPMGQGTDFRLQRPDGPVADERVDVPLVRASLATPPDVESQEVDPVAEVSHAGFLRREPQTHRCENLSYLFTHRLGVVLGPMDEDDEVIGVADQPPRR